MNSRLKLLPGLLGPLTYLSTLTFFRPEGLSSQGIAVLACTLWVAIWWVFEVTDISVTSLLPIVIFPLSGAMDLSRTTASYGHKYLFIYMGGFIIAMAIERWNLHKRIALTIIKLLGTDSSKIILGFMIATAFLSMWISNTATSVMMLPIGLALVLQMKELVGKESEDVQVFSKALMLAIAYSASIGGMATLIGTPPNLVLSGVVKELYGVEISFARWLSFGLPISITLLIGCWYYLTKRAFKFKTKEFPGGATAIKRSLKELGPISYEEKVTLIVFLSTALLWIARSQLQQILPALEDPIIAIAGGMILLLWPAKKGKKALLSWKEAVKMPWGIMILFGAGMAMATGFQQSGLAVWIGEQFTMLEGLPIFLLVLILVAMVNFLTEITSNLATTAMLLPILAPIAISVGTHPYILLVSATISASCAFMLPVATPPNAVVFGSGYLKISDMIRKGIWLNVISIIFITCVVYFLLPYLWDFDATSFPATWNTF